MIEIPYYRDHNFCEWYCERVFEIIKRKRNRKVVTPDKSFDQFVDMMNSLSVDEIKAILCVPRKQLEQQEWIKEYLKLADFIGYYPLFIKQCKGKNDRCSYIEKYNGIYLEKIHHGNSEEYCRSHNKFCALKRQAKECLKRLNDIIKKIISYDFFDAEFRRALFARMDVKVCPYCNHQYVFSMSGGQYLGDIDHILPQSIYALFALSIWNLVPSCKTCNQSHKRNAVVDILYPTISGFGQDAIFWVEHGSIQSFRGESSNFEYKWMIKNGVDKAKKIKIEENIKLFSLNELYSDHKAIIKDVLRKKYYFDERFMEDYRKRLNISSEDDINYSIYGCSLNPEKFKDEVLSKMKYDIVRNG